MNAIEKPRHIINRRLITADTNFILQGGIFEPTMRQKLVSRLKIAHHDGCNEVRKRFEKTARSSLVLAGNTLLIDQLVRVIFDIATNRVYPVANRTTSECLSVVAVGGYGRCELAPYSDIDLMFLCPYKQTPYIEQIVEFI